MTRPLSRRDFARRALIGLAVAATPPALAACSAAPPPSPTAPAAPAPSAAAASSSPVVATPRAVLSGADRQVRVNVLGVAAEAPLRVAMEKGYFQAEDLEVEPVPGLPGIQSIPAVGTGELDIAPGAVGPALFRAIERGINAKLIAPVSYMTETHSTVWISRRADLQDQLRSLKDLRGTRMAFVGHGGINDYVLAKAFQREGLDAMEALEYVTLEFPAMPAALANRAVETVLITEPMATTAVDLGVGDRWLNMAQLAGRPVVVTGILAGPSFLAKGNGETAKRWMKAYLRGAQEYHRAFILNNDPALRAQLISILVKTTSITDPALFDQMTYAVIPPDGTLDEASIRDQLAYWESTGVAVPPLETLIDLRPAREA
jgi:NitT/TauT family transport system substrate-binding protein